VKALTLAQRAGAYESAMWRSLFRWVTRRPVAPGPNGQAFRYSGTMTPLLIVFIAVSAIELPILHLLLPWETVRLIVDIASVYGLLWMFGLLAIVRVYPHVATDDGLRVRSGFNVDFTIPWAAVASVRSRNRPVEGKGVQIERTETAVIAQVGVMKQTAVDLVLREPTVVALPQADGEPVTEVRLYVDDPDALVRRAKRHLDTSTRANI
jgi:Bacterial PH domain